jgi:hypothetical protein
MKMFLIYCVQNKALKLISLISLSFINVATRKKVKLLMSHPIVLLDNANLID